MARNEQTQRVASSAVAQHTAWIGSSGTRSQGLKSNLTLYFFTTQSLWLLVLMGGSQVWQCQQLISLYHVWRSNKYKSLVGARNIDYFLISSTSATKSIVKTFALHAAGKGMAEWMNFELSSMRSWRTVGSPGLCS